MTDRRIDFGANEEQAQKLPTGTVFQPTGLIAPWRTVICYTFMSQADNVRELGADTLVTYDSGWNRLYYINYDAAALAMKELGEQYTPQTVWRYQVESKDIINVKAENLTKFPDVVSRDIAVFTTASKKRHEFHMIALPAAVASIAKLYGFIDHEYDLSDLLLANDTDFTEEFQWKMIGNLDHKVDDEYHWTKSLLWNRRAELWNELGEPDPMNYVIPREDEKRNLTYSKKLQECLRIVTMPWNNPVWARMVDVPNPKFDQQSNDGKRYGIGAFTELFFDKASALAVLDEDETFDNIIELPAEWKEHGEEVFLTELRNAVAEGMSKPAMMRALAVTALELNAWLTRV